LWMPDYFYTPDQWQLVERAIYFVKQFYNGSVTHREFMTTSYLPDQTKIHVNLYGTIWPYDAWGGIAGDSFMCLARIPFVSVRPWTSKVGDLSYGKQHSLIWVMLGIAFGIYNGTTSFGAYDAIGNDFGKVAVYVMRDVDRVTVASTTRTNTVPRTTNSSTTPLSGSGSLVATAAAVTEMTGSGGTMSTVSSLSAMGMVRSGAISTVSTARLVTSTAATAAAATATGVSASSGAVSVAVSARSSTVATATTTTRVAGLNSTLPATLPVVVQASGGRSSRGAALALSYCLRGTVR
jgi:hypothetical protein